MAVGAMRSVKVDALFSKGKPKSKPPAKKAPAKRKSATTPRAPPRKSGTQSLKPQSVNKSSVSQDKFGRELWLPNTEPPAWLDGSLPGDRGFDPLGLSRPSEYIQMTNDALDQNAAVNKAGVADGRFRSLPANVSTDSFQPYSEVFDLNRFRECELIHGRWAMLATLGCIVGELATGVSWVDAGKVGLETSQWAGLDLPFDLQQHTIAEVFLVGGAEVYRNSELDTSKRLYPGGYFDPLGFASKSEDQTARLKEAEIKHSRLAMVAMFGYATQAGFSGSTSLLQNLKDVFN